MTDKDTMERADTQEWFMQVCFKCKHVAVQPMSQCPRCGYTIKPTGIGHGVMQFDPTADRYSEEYYFHTYAEVLDVSLSNRDPEHPVRIAVRLARRRQAWKRAHRMIVLAWDLSVLAGPEHDHAKEVGISDLVELVRAELGDEVGPFEQSLASADAVKRELLADPEMAVHDRAPQFVRKCRCGWMGFMPFAGCPRCNASWADLLLFTPHGHIRSAVDRWVFEDHDDCLDRFLGPEKTVIPQHPWRRALHAAMKRGADLTVKDITTCVSRLYQGGVDDDPTELLGRLTDIVYSELGDDPTALLHEIPGVRPTVLYIASREPRSM